MTRMRPSSRQIRSSSRPDREQGFTLVEVMMALAVLAIVVGAGFGVLIASEKATHTSGQIVDAQQSARLAMDLLSRDIKMAGFGWQSNMNVGNCQVPAAAPATAAPIVPVDNNAAGLDVGPDGIRLVVPMTNTQTLAGTGAPVAAWTLSAATTPGFSQIQLQPGAVAAMTSAGLFSTSTVVSINGAFAAQVTAPSGANGLQLQNPAQLHINFPIGAQVYLLQCINYTVANNPAQCGNLAAPCLMRGPIGPGGAPNQQVAIADGIEDLQFAYACDGCTLADLSGDGVIDDQGDGGGFTAGDFVTNSPWNAAPMTSNKIRMVQVNLVARQAARAADLGLGEGRAAALLTPNALQISDHNHANGVFVAGDFGGQTPPYTSVRRRTLTKTVDVRNIPLCDAC